MEKKDWYNLSIITSIFLLFYFVEMRSRWFTTSLIGGLTLLNEYAQEHVLTCLIPALFIAGAIIVFVKREHILKFLGQDAKKYVSYSVASISGALLAVCSCTILPLFAGIRKRGAGLGPAITFLFSGPAINIAAIFLTMSVLGYKIGVARIIAAILISIITGLSMALLFKEDIKQGTFLLNKTQKNNISNMTIFSFFLLLISFLIVNGLQIDQTIKYALMVLIISIIIVIVVFKFNKQTTKAWLEETWVFSKTILPLLFVGVFIAGFIMPLIPNNFVESVVGQNTISGNFIGSIFGAFMYFSTLTEIPIVQGLIDKGMHLGPALALLLAGPSLSLPNLLVIRKVLGNKKTFVYLLLVIFYSTLAGLLFGFLV